MIESDSKIDSTNNTKVPVPVNKSEQNPPDKKKTKTIVREDIVCQAYQVVPRQKNHT